MSNPRAVRPDARHERALEIALGHPFVDGNALEIFENGEHIFPAMLDSIARARRSIDFLTFVLWESQIGQQMVNALAQRARAGVQVRVLLDAFGSADAPQAYLETLREAGCEVRVFRPLSRLKFWRANLRTHRKVLVCDAGEAMFGGVGISDEWQGNGREPGQWRDTQFRMTGPSVDGLRSGFLSNWVDAGGKLFHDLDFPPRAKSRDGARLQVIQSNGGTGWSNIAVLWHAAVAVAQEQLRICTAYFVPDASGRDLLVAAAERGVHVQVLVPGPHADKWQPRAAGRHKYQRLLDAGVEIHEYQPTMLHAKVMLIDRKLAIVGSPNFNHRSVRRDDEVAVAIHDPGIASRLSNSFDADLRHAEQLDADRWRARPWRDRCLQWLAGRLRHEL